MRYLAFVIFFFVFCNQQLQGQNNAPVSTLGTVATYGSTANIPVTVTNFNGVTSCMLEIHYDSTIAIATAVNYFNLPGSVMYFLETPGVIEISWVTAFGISLPDNTIIFSLDFSRVNPGYTPVSFYDDGYSCFWSDTNQGEMNDIPASSFYQSGWVNFRDPNAPHVIVDNVSGCGESTFDIPVSVTDFKEIGQLNLTMVYDPSVASFQSFNNPSGFPGLTVVQITPGELNIYGNVISGNQGITLPDSSVLIILHFYSDGGISYLDWYDDGASCAISGPPPDYFLLNDQPQAQYYFDGILEATPLPGAAGQITGPAGGETCRGSTGVVFSVEPVMAADAYSWSFPPGFMILSGGDSNVVNVSVTGNAQSGLVEVYGYNECGVGFSSPMYQVIVSDPPWIISQPVSPPSVAAGVGTAVFTVSAGGTDVGYQWQVLNSVWEDLTEGGFYSGVLTNELTVHQPDSSMNGNHYRCRVSGFCPPDIYTDGQAVLSVSPVIGVPQKDLSELQMKVFQDQGMENVKVIIDIPGRAKVTFRLLNLQGIVLGESDVFLSDAGITIVALPFQPSVTGVYLLLADIRNDTLWKSIYQRFFYLK